MGVKCKTFLAVSISWTLPVFPFVQFWFLLLADHRSPPLRLPFLQTAVGPDGSCAPCLGRLALPRRQAEPWEERAMFVGKPAMPGLPPTDAGGRTLAQNAPEDSLPGPDAVGTAKTCSLTSPQPLLAALSSPGLRNQQRVLFLS